MNYLSVCSGIEAATVAWHPLGWSPVLYSEIEKFPRRVLTHHYPDVRLWGDFTAIRPRFLRRLGLPMPSLLVGGTPCQAFSVAGARRSLDDARGNLTLSFVRLAHALANTGSLRNVVWENVPGVLSTKDNAFGCFLGALVGGDAAIQPPGGRSWPNSGMVSGPKGRAAWTVKDAQYFGLAQRRRRVFVVADFGNGADPAAVLFEPVSLLGNFAPRREAGQGVAGTVTASVGGVSGKDDINGRVTQVTASDVVGYLAAEMGQGNQFAMSGHYIGYAPELSRCDATREGSSQDYETTTMVAHAIQAGALRTNPESGPDGVGVQEGVAYTIEARAEVQAVCITGEITHTLKAEGFDASEDGTGRGQPLVATSFARQSSFADEGSEEIAGTLVKNQTMAVHLGPAVAFAQNTRDELREMPIAGALSAQPGMKQTSYARIGSAVRRLTPKECERLQGFPEIHREVNFTVCAEEKHGNAPFVVQNSQRQNHAPKEHADVHVQIDSERQHLRLLSQGKLIWSASVAEQSNKSPLPIPAADFVQFIAHIMPCVAPLITTGREESPKSGTLSLHRLSGSASAHLYGFEISELAKDAETLMTAMDGCMRSITYTVGQPIQISEQTLTALGYCVLSVINGSIPTTIFGKSSFALRLEHTTGYTLLPGYDADGPRYKALGNSMAVPCMRWIGERIAANLPAANDNGIQHERSAA